MRVLALFTFFASAASLLTPPSRWCARATSPLQRSALPPRCAADSLDDQVDDKQRRVRELQAELARLQAADEALDDEDEDEDDELLDLDDDELARPAARTFAAAAPPRRQAEFRVVGLTEDPSNSLPAGSVVCIAGCGTALGKTLLQTIATDAAGSGWGLRALVGAGEASPGVPGVEEASAAPAALSASLDGASALVVISAGAAGAGGVATDSVGRLLAALPDSGVRRLVYVSVHGVDRTSELPYSVQNAFGGKLDRAREAEGEVLLWAETHVPSVSVVRFGGLKEGGGGATAYSLAAGDALKGEVPLAAAAGVVLQTLLRPEAVNATFSAGAPAEGGSPDSAWVDDEFLKLVGPEVHIATV